MIAQYPAWRAHAELLRGGSWSRAPPVHAIAAGGYRDWLSGQPAHVRAWLEGSQFEAKPGRSALLPGADGAPGGALLLHSEPAEPWDFAALRERLPAGDWRLEPADGDLDLGAAALGWALASYRFDRYRKKETKPVRLVAAADPAVERTNAMAEAIFLARDLINTPAADLGPAELAEAASAVAARLGAACRIIAGEDLLQHDFPAVHAVGQASPRPPRVIDLTSGRDGRTQAHPGRQGRVLRYRRPRPQDVERHAADEEGHGRRRGHPRPCAGGHGARAARAPAPADRRGREQRQRQQLPPGGRPAHAQGADRRGRQHRCRGAPGAG